MADVFDFYVRDNRKINFEIAEPIMREDSGVTNFRFHIPKIINNLDMSDWAWWFVFVNAKNEKYSIALTLSDDPESPLENNIALYTVDYAMSVKAGKVQFALEAINTGVGGAIDNEWHTLTYETKVKDTLQGNQAEYAETESDIISALLEEVRTKMNQVIGGATPEPVNLKSQMTDPKAVYLYIGSEPNESAGYWYYHNGTQFVPGGVYGAGVQIDPTLTQSGQAAGAWRTGLLTSNNLAFSVQTSVEFEIDTVNNGIWINIPRQSNGYTAALRMRGKFNATDKWDNTTGKMPTMDTSPKGVAESVFIPVNSTFSYHYDPPKQYEVLEIGVSNINVLYTTIFMVGEYDGKPCVVGGIGRYLYDEWVQRKAEKIPEYWDAEIETSIETVQNNITASAIDSVSFAIVTDCHWNNNAKHSPAIVKEVIANTNVNYFLNLGDFLYARRVNDKEGAIQEIIDCINAFRCARLPMLCLYGNHDRNLNGNSNTETYISKIESVNILFKSFMPVYGIHSLSTWDSYYWDDENHRYICMYWYQTRANLPTWIATAFNTDKKIIVFVHGIYACNESTGVVSVESQWVLDYLEPYKNKIRCIIQGHTHLDGVRYAWSTNTPIIMLDCDALETMSEEGNAEGTIAEQSIAVVTVDSTAIKVCKIGRGTDFTVSV